MQEGSASTPKSKNSESFYINFAYIDENGKSTSRIYRKLGTLKELSQKLNTDRDGVMAWAKEQARLDTEKYNKENEILSIPFSPNQLIEKGTQHSFNCGYLFLQSILADLRIDNMCRNIKNRHKYEFDLKAIFADLIYSRILYPSSKRSSYNFAQSLLEQPKYDLHHIYRSLPILASESDYIQAEVYRNSNFIHKRNTKILYYDCTNYYFEITQEDGDKKYGKGKEHRPNPIIGMGLFMDADGFPLAFDLYPGNQNEQKTLNPLEQKVIRDFGCSEFIYCSDSGLGSQNNKLLNDTNGRAYIITQSLKKLEKEVRSTALDPNQYRKLGSNRFIMTYSPKYRAYQAKIRQAQIERAMKMIGKGGKPKRNRKNPNDPARFIRTTAVTENGEAASEIFCELNQEIIDQEAMYDGFYAVTTDLDGDVSEIIAINQRRWQIEECFRIMKTDFEARPVYVRLEECIKAHFLTCFLALLVYRLLEKKLENKYTVETTLDTLRQMNVCELEGYGYIPTYKRTDLTDELHNLFGFRTDTQIIKKTKMRNIIKCSKMRDKLR